MVGEVTKNLMVTLIDVHSSSVEVGEPFRMTTISAVLHQSGLYGRVARWKPLLSKAHDSPIGVCLKTPKGFSGHEKQDWSDENKIELFGLNVNRHIWRKNGTILTVKHGGGSIMLWECFSVAGTGKLVTIEGKMNREKYREILDENLLQRAQNLRLG